MLGAQGIRATGFKRAQGNAHCAKFESNTNRMTFEYAPNMMIVKVHPQKDVTLPFSPPPSGYPPLSYPPPNYLMLPNLTNHFIKLSDGDLQCE